MEAACPEEPMIISRRGLRAAGASGRPSAGVRFSPTWGGWAPTGRGTGDVVVDAAAPGPFDPVLLADALEAVPEGIAVFDGDWTIVYVNRAAAGILQRDRGQLLGRNIWIALPELGGTILHSFLLHARSAGSQVTWHGYYAPAALWLDATAVARGDRLHLSIRPGVEHSREDATLPVTEGTPDADAERLRFLAEVSESMISTL